MTALPQWMHECRYLRSDFHPVSPLCPFNPHHGIMHRVETFSRQGKGERGGRWEAPQCYPTLVRYFCVHLRLRANVSFFCVLVPSVDWLEMNKTKQEMCTEDPLSMYSTFCTSCSLVPLHFSYPSDSFVHCPQVFQFCIVWKGNSL